MIRGDPLSDPCREKRFSPAEVRRILRRAAELAEKDPETAAAEKSLTRGDLERAAADLGIPSTALSSALAGDVPQGAQPTTSNAFLGAPTRILLEEEVEGEPSEEDREDLLEAIRVEIGEGGFLENVGKTFTWRLAPMMSRGSDLTVRLRSRNGRTRIVIEENLARRAIGLFVGLGVGGGVGPMGAYIALIMNFGALFAIVPVVWICSMVLLARTI